MSPRVHGPAGSCWPGLMDHQDVLASTEPVGWASTRSPLF